MLVQAGGREDFCRATLRPGREFDQPGRPVAGCSCTFCRRIFPVPTDVSRLGCATCVCAGTYLRSI